MKLAIIMPPYEPMPPINGSGLERLCDIILQANEQATDPLEITVFCRFDARAVEISKNYRHSSFVYIEVTRSEPRSNRVMRWLFGKLGGKVSKTMRYDYMSGLKKELKKFSFDRVLLANCPEYATGVAKHTGTKPILYARDAFYSNSCCNIRRELKYISRFIFPSEFMRNAAVNTGVPANRSSVLLDCVDTQLFDALKFVGMRSEKRAKYGLSDDDILLVFVGRLVPDKGAVELVKAVAQSSWNRSKLKLLIVGSVQPGEDVRDEYREMLESAAPEGKIVFIGSVKPTSAARFLARADIAAVPSIKDETGGLSVLEAMSVGLPIVMTDSGALGEYTSELGEGVTVVKRGLGCVTSIARAIDSAAERLASDPEWRKKVADEARKAALKFDSAGYYALFRAEIER